MQYKELKILIYNYFKTFWNFSLLKNIFLMHKNFRKYKNYKFINLIRFFIYLFSKIRISKHDWKIIWYSILPSLNNNFWLKNFINTTKNIFEENLKNKDFNFIWPWYVNISITENCPYSCSHCSAWNRKNWKEMHLDDFKKMSYDLHKLWTWVIWLTWWEPLTHSNLNWIIRTIKTNDIDVYLVTTWYWLDLQKAKSLKKDWLFWICISFDTTDAKKMWEFRWIKNAQNISINAIKTSLKAWLYVLSTIVATKENIWSWDLEKSIKFLKKIWIHEVQVLYLMPSWRTLQNKKVKDLLIKPKEKKYLKDLQIKANSDFNNYPKLISLSFLDSNEMFWCNAWNQHLYVETTWELYPCDFVEISYWNVFKDWFEKVYKNMQRFYNKQWVSCLAYCTNQKRAIEEKWKIPEVSCKTKTCYLKNKNFPEWFKKYPKPLRILLWEE